MIDAELTKLQERYDKINVKATSMLEAELKEVLSDGSRGSNTAKVCSILRNKIRKVGKGDDSKLGEMFTDSSKQSTVSK